MDKKFEKWVREKHLKECNQCRKEGRARLIDYNAYAIRLFKEFYGKLQYKR